MEQLNFDSGIREYKINNNGVLRFNPGDPNVYARFMEASEKIQAVEKMMESKMKALGDSETDGAAVLQILAEADKQMKEILNWVFGKGNDFDEILEGVNLMAVATNGERVVTNLLNALLPIIHEGAENCAKQQIGDAVQQAQVNRAARRAKPKA